MSVEKGTIFAFVVPALVIILVIKAVTLDTMCSLLETTWWPGMYQMTSAEPVLESVTKTCTIFCFLICLLYP